MIRVLTWAFVIFFLWYMVTSPAGAAAWVHGVLGWVAHAGSSLSAFVDSLLAPASAAFVGAALVDLVCRPTPCVFTTAIAGPRPPVGPRPR